jgi:hypothetical protein
LLVEKEDCGQGLVLCGCRDVFVDGQVGQKAVNIVFRKLTRMPMLVKLDVPANPVDVGLFRATAVVPDS